MSEPTIEPTTEPTIEPTNGPTAAPTPRQQTGPAPDSLMPPAPRVRIVVERADDPRCGIRVGDSVDVDGPGLSTGGRPFCPKALMAAVPVLGMRQGALPADDWLFRKPFVCCPDARENVVLRLEAL